MCQTSNISLTDQELDENEFQLVIADHSIDVILKRREDHATPQVVEFPSEKELLALRTKVMSGYLEACKPKPVDVLDRSWEHIDHIKKILEDAIMVSRVHKAPERRVYNIDTSSLSPEVAKKHIEMIKNEIYQRRIDPLEAASIIDAPYTPLAISDDYFICLPADGSGSRAEQLVDDHVAALDIIEAQLAQTAKELGEILSEMKKDK